MVRLPRRVVRNAFRFSKEEMNEEKANELPVDAELVYRTAKSRKNRLMTYQLNRPVKNLYL